MRTNPATGSRGIATIALVALMVGVSFKPVLHEEVGHDADCNPVIVAHDASQHRIEAGPSAAHPAPGTDHCVACQLFRYSGNSDSQGTVAGDHLRISLIARPDNSARLASRSALPLPARAPPSHS